MAFYKAGGGSSMLDEPVQIVYSQSLTSGGTTAVPTTAGKHYYYFIRTATLTPMTTAATWGGVKEHHAVVGTPLRYDVVDMLQGFFEATGSAATLSGVTFTSTGILFVYQLD